MKQYVPEKMVAQSRYRRYFPTLPADVQQDAYARVRELVEEERAYCDEGNYAHMTQILTSIALDEIPDGQDHSIDAIRYAMMDNMLRG